MAPSYRKGRPLPWLAQVRDANGKMVTMSFAKREDALGFEETERRKRQLTRAGLRAPSDEILLIDAVQKWLKKREQNGEITRSSWAQDEGRFRNYWLEKFGKRPITTLTTAEIREHLDYIQLELGHAPGDRNRHRALLHTFFQDMFMEDRVQANPVSRIELLSEKKKRRKFGELRPEDHATYTRGMYGIRRDYGILADLMAWTGGRIMACAAVQVRDVDFETGTVRLCRIIERESHSLQDRTKGGGDGGEETVPLLPILRERLLAHLKHSHYTRPSDFIANRPGGGWLQYESYMKAHDIVISRAGLRRFTPHAVRGFFATNAKRAGFTRVEIMEMLGHSSEAMTARYDKKDIEHLVNRAAKLQFGATSVIPLSSKTVRRIGLGENKS